MLGPGGALRSGHMVRGVRSSGPTMSGAAAALPGGKGLVESVYEMLWTKNNLLQVVACERLWACERRSSTSVCSLPALPLTCGCTCVLSAADALHVPQVPPGPYSRHGAARQQVSHDLVRVIISLSNVHFNLILLLLHFAFSWPGASDPAPYSCHTYPPTPVTPITLLL